MSDPLRARLGEKRAAKRRQAAPPTEEPKPLPGLVTQAVRARHRLGGSRRRMICSGRRPMPLAAAGFGSGSSRRSLTAAQAPSIAGSAPRRPLFPGAAAAQAARRDPEMAVDGEVPSPPVPVASKPGSLSCGGTTESPQPAQRPISSPRARARTAASTRPAERLALGGIHEADSASPPSAVACTVASDRVAVALSLGGPPRRVVVHRGGDHPTGSVKMGADKVTASILLTE